MVHENLSAFKSLSTPLPGVTVHNKLLKRLPFSKQVRLFLKRNYARLNPDRGLYGLFRNTNVVFVRLPKNASTSICTLLYGSNLKSTWPEHHSAHYYKNVYPDFYNKKVSFSTIRNPYDRFQSAFNYIKYKTEDEYDRNIIDNELKHVENFEDFLKYVSESKNLDNLSILNIAVFRRQIDFICDLDGRIIVDLLFPVENMRDGMLELDKYASIDTSADIPVVNKTQMHRPYKLPVNLQLFYKDDIELWDMVNREIIWKNPLSIDKLNYAVR